MFLSTVFNYMSNKINHNKNESKAIVVALRGSLKDMLFTSEKLSYNKSNNLHFISFKQAPVPKSELCTVCRRRAYPMDAVIVDKKKYHKSCFCCEHCSNKLR